MRTLNKTEMNTVSGGSPGEILFGFGIGMIASAIYHYASQPTLQCKTLFDQQPYYYDVTTKVYDSYGVYQGDVVDTYQDFKYVPVTVCI
jgi:hypothetical protein